MERSEQRYEAAIKAADGLLLQASNQQQYPSYAAQCEGPYGSAPGSLKSQPLCLGIESATEEVSLVLEMAAWPAAPIDTCHTVLDLQ